MARRYGRCPRGERLRMSVPHGHWKTTTGIAGLRNSGIVAPLVIDGAVDRDVFETWVEHVLIPELRVRDVVVMDNLSSHKGPRVKALIQAAGAELQYLPPYSPDFNPIENAFAKLKTLLRKEAAAPSIYYGPPSDASSTSSHPQSASTCSLQQDTIQSDGIPL